MYGYVGYIHGQAAFKILALYFVFFLYCTCGTTPKPKPKLKYQPNPIALLKQHMDIMTWKQQQKKEKSCRPQDTKPPTTNDEVHYTTYNKNTHTHTLSLLHQSAQDDLAHTADLALEPRATTIFELPDHAGKNDFTHTGICLGE